MKPFVWVLLTCFLMVACTAENTPSPPPEVKHPVFVPNTTAEESTPTEEEPTTPDPTNYESLIFEVQKEAGQIYVVDAHQNRHLLAQSLDKLSPQVTALDLSKQGLTEFPQELLEHPQLQILILTSNTIEELPANINQLNQLQYLDVSDNQLKAIPTAIGQLPQLEQLKLSVNPFGELPASIGQLEQLRVLHLDYVRQLKELPTSIGQLTALEELQLDFTLLTTLPNTIGQLKALRKLGITARYFEALPASFGQLAQLEEFWLHSEMEHPAPIKNLPKNFHQLKNLKEVNLFRLSIPEADIEALKQKMPWCTIEYEE